MVRMHVGDEGDDPLPAEPGDHHLRSFLGVAVTLMGGGDDPGDLGGEKTSLLGHRGLHGPDGTSVVEAADDPVEPPLGAVRGVAHDLAPVTLPKFSQVGRLAAGEGVQAGVVEQRSHLLRMLDAQRLQPDPATL